MRGSSKWRRTRLRQQHMKIAEAIDNGLYAITVRQAQAQGVDLESRDLKIDDSIEVLRDLKNVMGDNYHYGTLAENQIIQNTKVSEKDIDMAISILEVVRDFEGLVPEEQWTLNDTYAVDEARETLKEIERHANYHRK